MKQSTFKITVLEASENMYFTQVKDIPIAERIIASKLVLAINDSPDNYREITKEEADTYREAKEQYFKNKKYDERTE